MTNSVRSRLGRALALPCGLLLSAAACEFTRADGVALRAADGVHGAAGEITAVQSFLDGLYLRSDVRHSFRNRSGDTVDCVDFHAERGVRAMLASGVVIEPPRAPPVVGPARRPSAAPGDAYLTGDADENGDARACPDGTVAHVRLTAAHILAAGGLHAYERALLEEPVVTPPLDGDPVPSSVGSSCPGRDRSGHARVVGGVGEANGQPIAQGAATLSVDAPVIYESLASYDHSLAQVWLRKGGQTVEAGWIVAPGPSGEDPQDGAAPRLFIGATADDYAQTWCRDGDLPAPFKTCVPWIPFPGASLYLHAPLTPSTPGGPQHEIATQVRHRREGSLVPVGNVVVCDGCVIGWEVDVSVDGGPMVALGYYPDAGFAAYDPRGLADGASRFDYGAEVLQAEAPPFTIAMGAGTFLPGEPAFPYWAYVRDVSAQPGSRVVAGALGCCSTRGEYRCSSADPPGDPSWRNWFYYGNAPTYRRCRECATPPAVMTP